ADAAIRKTASADLMAKVAAMLKQPPSDIAASVQKSVEAATVAYYPFETTAPIPDDQLPKSRTRRGQKPPPDLVSPFRRGGGGPPPAPAPAPGAQAAQTAGPGRGAPRLSNGMIREKLVFSPSGLSGG